MDIKNALSAILPNSLKAKNPIDKSIKSGNTTDRDANGQQAFGEQKKKRDPMTDQEFAKALEHLKNLDIVKTSTLKISASMAGEKRLVIVEDPTGKIIRRISEEELWSLLDSPDKNRGQLLSKAA